MIKKDTRKSLEAGRKKNPKRRILVAGCSKRIKEVKRKGDIQDLNHNHGQRKKKEVENKPEVSHIIAEVEAGLHRSGAKGAISKRSKEVAHPIIKIRQIE